MPFVTHYLMFNRVCSQAMELYKEAFGGEILETQKYGDMPPNPDFPIPESDRELVLHARLKIGGAEIMAADSGEPRGAGENMYVAVTFPGEDAGAAQRAWDTLRPGGEIYMELSPAFFAALHGSLRDRFGINWMFTVMR